MKRVAYDYDKQAWFEGDEARRLLISQLGEDCECLTDTSYQRFRGITEAEAINEFRWKIVLLADIRAELKAEDEAVGLQPCYGMFKAPTSPLMAATELGWFSSMPEAIKALDPFQYED